MEQIFKNNRKVIFLTGATGFIGRNLLFKMMQEENTAEFILIVRGNDDEDAYLRIENLIKDEYGDYADKFLSNIKVYSGDLTKKHFNLKEEDYCYLQEKTTHIIHCAANVNFNNSLEKARGVNFVGTKNVIEFAQKVNQLENLQKVVHVSTAYVSGSKKGLIYENDNCKPDSFSNSYEQSKYETEKYIMQFMQQLPLIILRPSIVIGNSISGKTCSFNVLYNPLQMMFKGYLNIIPSSKKTRIDIVPVDFVTDAAYFIIFKTKNINNRIFHLTSGANSSPNIGEIVNLAMEYFNKSKDQLKKVRFISPKIVHLFQNLLSKKSLRLLKMMDIYLPYINQTRVFDNTNTIEALRDSDINLPEFQNYFNQILKYSVATNWGRN